MSKVPVIEFKDFSFKYRSQNEYTLMDINLTIYEGEKVLLLGPSGCGKSTLANCINGLIPFSFHGEMKGSCKVAGREVSQASIFQISEYVGTILQDSDAQFVGLSAGEDIAFLLENDCVPRKKMLEMVDEAARIVDMEDFLDHVPFDLSGGQKQKVALGGVLHNKESKVLLFDEPLAALDPKMGNVAVDLIDRIQQNENKTVVMIEHRLEDVLYRHVDRIVLMQDGRIVKDTSPDELLRSNALKVNGIREPLYITALKHAGCTFSDQEHLANVHELDVSKFVPLLQKEMETVVKSEEKKLGDVLIDVDHVSFSYDGEHDVLSDVSFTIRRGEKIALIGKNGAGKSTMAKVLCGILRPDTGNVMVNGVNASTYSIKELGSKIGYVMQNPNQMIVKDMIFDEVALALKLNGYDEGSIRDRVFDTLKMCGLYPMRNWPVEALSYGQKKRVTIASILALRPDLMILDEPTAGQDYKRYTEIMEFLDTLNREYGVTIVFITHDMHLAIEYTDRALVFSDCKLIGDDSVFTVLSDPDLIEQANLKQTSLYHLAKAADIPVADFIQHFIEVERKGNVDGQEIID